MDSIEVGGAQRLGKSLQPGRLRVALAHFYGFITAGGSRATYKLRVGMEAPCRHGSSVSAWKLRVHSDDKARPRAPFRRSSP